MKEVRIYFPSEAGVYACLCADAALSKSIISEKSIGFWHNSSGLPSLAHDTSLEELTNSGGCRLFYDIAIFTSDVMVICSIIPIKINKCVPLLINLVFKSLWDSIYIKPVYLKCKVRLRPVSFWPVLIAEEDWSWNRVLNTNSIIWFCVALSFNLGQELLLMEIPFIYFQKCPE